MPIATVSVAKTLNDPTLPPDRKEAVTTDYGSNIRMIKQNLNGKSEVVIGSQSFIVGDELSYNSRLTKINLEQITVVNQEDGKTEVIALNPFTIKTAVNNLKEKQNVS